MCGLSSSTRSMFGSHQNSSHILHILAGWKCIPNLQIPLWAPHPGFRWQVIASRWCVCNCYYPLNFYCPAHAFEANCSCCWRQSSLWAPHIVAGAVVAWQQRTRGSFLFTYIYSFQYILNTLFTLVAPCLVSSGSHCPFLSSSLPHSYFLDLHETCKLNNFVFSYGCFLPKS